MYQGKSILAVVTARGGSKGLPGKNIKILKGKPLIAWTIEQIKKSKLIDETFISTDSLEIANVCETLGITVPELRPAELAEDTTSSMDVLIYTLKLFEAKNKIFDYLLLLEPTSPLRKENDIDNIIKIACDNPEADGVVSLGRVHMEHPGIVKRIGEGGFIEPYMKHGPTFYQRQLEDEAYFPYGVGYLVRVDKFKRAKTIYMEKMLPYIIERWQNYEVDDIYDFCCIEAVMRMEKRKL